MMKKAISVLLSLLLLFCTAFSLPLPAQAAAPAGSGQNLITVSTAAQLQSAVEVENAYVRLLNDITLSSNGHYINMNRSGVTLDLNGRTIRAADWDTGDNTESIFHLSGDDIVIRGGRFEAENPNKMLVEATNICGDFMLEEVDVAGFGGFINMRSKLGATATLKTCTFYQARNSTRWCVTVDYNNTVILDGVSIDSGNTARTSVFVKIDGNGLGYKARFVMRNVYLYRETVGPLVLYQPDQDAGGTAQVGEMLDPEATLQVDGAILSPSTAFTPAEWGSSSHRYLMGTNFSVTCDTDYLYGGSANITPPKAGASPDYEPELPQGAPYYSSTYSTSTFQNDVFWKDETTGNSVFWEDDVFVAGHIYTVNIFLTPSVGYDFSPKGMLGRVNGKTAEATYYSPDQQLVLSYTFPEVVAPPSITKQPQNQTVGAGSTASFSVTASGSGLSYQWQYQKPGTSTWNNCGGTGYNTNTFSFTASAYYNGWQYRCVVSNSGGSVTSGAARLTVSGAGPVITKQPQNQTVSAGQTAKFTVAASGSGLSYQWQYQKPGTSAWNNCGGTGNKTDTFSFTASAYYNGWQYRCVVKNSAGSVNSNAAKLTVTG